MKYVTGGEDRARLPHGKRVRRVLQREFEPREDGCGEAARGLSRSCFHCCPG